MLGSSRVIVQSNGTLCYDGDLTPFGAERAYTNTCAQNYKFEGKERDTETGNDDFGAREYSWRFGRWLSSDWSATPVAVPYANLSNPQTLNLYAMVADDPESFADLDGHIEGNPEVQKIENTGSSDSDDSKQGHTGDLGLARDWLDVIEVSGSYGLSAGVSGQAGSEVKYEGTTGVTTEGTIGLGGGNGEVKVSGDVVNGKVKLGDYEGSVKAGVEVSSKDGVKAQASAEVSAGPVKASVTVDKTGVHTNAGGKKEGDVKLGVHGHAGLGVGVNINLSQAKRAYDRSVQSVNALGQYLIQKFMPTGSIF
jgi:RHS repeat-associated protein